MCGCDCVGVCGCECVCDCVGESGNVWQPRLIVSLCDYVSGRGCNCVTVWV